MATDRPVPPEDPLQTSAQYAKGVGPARFELLRKLGIETVGDLLFFFPRSYEDLSDFRSIAALTADTLQTAAGEVVDVDGRITATGKNLLSVTISDGSGRVLEGVWFNQPFMAKKFRFGLRVAFSGKPQWRMGHWQMNNPRVQVLGDEGHSPSGDTVVLPVYPLTEGLRAEQMRRIVRQVVEAHADKVPEVLPPHLLAKRGLPGIAQALRAVHCPTRLDAAQRARRRLVYEEFLILELALALRRRDLRDQQKAPVLQITRQIDERIRRLFPFELTADQNRAIRDICKDMASDRPMRRLLQADVGAGKTAVAVYALLLAVAHQHQAALMAPTEVLARQHWRLLSRYLAHSKVRRVLLTGGLTEKERKVALGEIRMGQVDLVVGTQALIQKDVEFAKLGLVVIDEQHRFGVLQRHQFRKLGEDPHYLVMTATPIPRTVALTVFGDLDVSVIRELPPGRKPVITRWVLESQRPRLEAHLVQELAKGRQLYVVCPLVEESETRDIKAAEQIAGELQTGVFKDFRVGLLHGRMDEKAKDQVMVRFRERDLQVLVSTSVIEVGVDVPNATLMVIEHADRFGLSQLHQLRGRVSRGPVAGECYIFAAADSEETKRRLRLFVRTRDGFALAEEDVRLRGMGEFFGTKQHGLGELRLGNLISDADVLMTAREDAFALVAADPGLRDPAHAGLRQAVFARYGKTLDLAEIG
jgi:ATP-dependent DNA helicase RecG